MMSDLQLITGLAIVISGFAQLRCGISTYHWMRVVQLTWFSSVTHLCCLTFLRDYFRQHRSAQIWRIPGMIALVILLIVALVPTGQYAWQISNKADRVRPAPFDHAICFWNHHHFSSEDEGTFKTVRQRMIISATLLGLGMLNRIWRLYRAPTIMFIHLHRRVSRPALCQLRKLHSRIALKNETNTRLSLVKQRFFRTFVYCPALAMALLTQLFLDFYTSMAFEVSQPCGTIATVGPWC